MAAEGEKKEKKRKILNSLETPVPWAVWCHWTRPSLSRNRSGLVDGIHTGSACRGSKSCPRMVKYLRAWRGGLGGELILMGLSSFPSQTCCLKRFGWLVNLERNLGSSWKKKQNKNTDLFKSFPKLPPIILQLQFDFSGSGLGGEKKKDPPASSWSL